VRRSSQLVNDMTTAVDKESPVPADRKIGAVCVLGLRPRGEDYRRRVSIAGELRACVGAAKSAK